MTLAIALSRPSREKAAAPVTVVTTAANTPEPLHREKPAAPSATTPPKDEESTRRLPPGKVYNGPVRVNGRLNPLVVEMKLQRELKSFETCYRQGLAENPRLQGGISVRFVVGRSGEATNIVNDGTELQDHRVLQCIQAVIERIQFPQPDGGIAVVRYRLDLTAG